MGQDTQAVVTRGRGAPACLKDNQGGHPLSGWQVDYTSFGANRGLEPFEGKGTAVCTRNKTVSTSFELLQDKPAREKEGIFSVINSLSKTDVASGRFQ